MSHIKGKDRILSCLKPPRPPSTNNYLSSPASQGYSEDITPPSSVQLSPTVNLSREYTLAVQTNSYGEIRRTFDQDNVAIGHIDFFEEPQLLEQVLRPSRECVQEALSLIRANSLTYLVATYFEHSERTAHLCLLVYQGFHNARLLYTPIQNLLDDLPLDFDSDCYSLSHSQCKLAVNVFLQFDRIENPFLLPDSHNFDDIRQCFSELRQQLDEHLRKSRSRVHLIRHCSTGSALCLIAAVVGVAISAVAIASHALVALVAGSICPAILPSNMTKKEIIHLAQLDAAAKGAYVLQNDLDTIDRLVARLHTAVENDKLLIRLGLERGMESYPIQEILKQLRRNRPSFMRQLVDLEEHLFLCLAAINKARTLLLQEIHTHQYPV
ncbi:UPF0496 protein At3g19330 [Sesamum indicum]|uniref:UPF0496 protein At3g19330 n=1 Tax=Sesamum indicum TaxID=4182 RepID=A0A6I9UIZ7_SESIN|nr:UPF0496 protein At3g19330 [Sesamum indicum]XP_011094275.1 UPF0496 protein At3g19330 [Sesamum indicum]XP_011094276.1 UPF0496 protein At3g19330 [Sesamum indicum]XP_020553231.1 UPF0496 protein At3g19330 [Sesamum indicum]XP_020553233.1 UPF0496 protein At3g19330 [Sesamum indicum]XP_020553234.1 UPF0496 protein At3g19330 [Sesamum indicum]